MRSALKLWESFPAEACASGLQGWQTTSVTTKPGPWDSSKLHEITLTSKGIPGCGPMSTQPLAPGGDGEQQTPGSGSAVAIVKDCAAALALPVLKRHKAFASSC